eukprot:COSAG04_NODE_1539_length_6420_cov_9.834045_4_plen_199_part_00
MLARRPSATCGHSASCFTSGRLPLDLRSAVGSGAIRGPLRPHVILVLTTSPGLQRPPPEDRSPRCERSPCCTESRRSQRHRAHLETGVRHLETGSSPTASCPLPLFARLKRPDVNRRRIGGLGPERLPLQPLAGGDPTKAASRARRSCRMRRLGAIAAGRECSTRRHERRREWEGRHGPDRWRGVVRLQPRLMHRRQR